MAKGAMKKNPMKKVAMETVLRRPASASAVLADTICVVAVSLLDHGTQAEVNLLSGGNELMDVRRGIKLLENGVYDIEYKRYDVDDDDMRVLGVINVAKVVSKSRRARLAQGLTFNLDDSEWQ